MGLRKSMVRVVMAVSIVLLALVSFMPVYSQNDLNFEFVKQVQARHEDGLFRLPGVIGVGIGQEGKRYVLHVYVNRQRGKPRLPVSIENVRVVMFEGDGDWEAASALAAYAPIDDGPAHRLTYPTPVPMGVSTSSDLVCTAGTLGFRAQDPVTGQVGYITNNHIAAAASGVCPNSAPIGTIQRQAGLVDTGCSTPGTNIGTLDRFVAIQFGSSTNNRTDAAFVASRWPQEKPGSVGDAAHWRVGSASLTDSSNGRPLADASGYCLPALRACENKR